MKKSESTRDEVEELLQSAQDELLLKLSLDSHMSRVSPDYLHPDLHRRFQALRSKPNSSNSPQSQPLPPPPQTSSSSIAQKDEDSKDVLGDDLSARFAALKSSIISSSSSTDASPGPKLSDGIDLHNHDDDDDDEVEKLIQWAVDAARLDPSPPSDDDDDSDKDFTDDEDDVDKKKGQQKCE